MEEISEGKAEVFRDGDNVVIRLAEQGRLYLVRRSCSPGFYPCLRKLKTAVSGEVNVKIEGHTDNVLVIENLRFKSNWDLSGARAGSVADYFIKKVGFHLAELMFLARGQSSLDPTTLLLIELCAGESRL